MDTARSPGRHGLRALPLATGALAALLYCNFLLDWVLRGFAGMTTVVSALESPGQPNTDLLRVTDVICALLAVVLAFWVRAGLDRGPWREIFAWTTVVFSVGAVLAAIIAEPCGFGTVCTDPHQVMLRDLHGDASIVSDTALFAGAFAIGVLTWRRGPAWFRRAAWTVLLGGGLVSSLVFGYYHRTPDPLWAVGISQRVHIAIMGAWLFALGLFAAGNHRPRRDGAVREP